MEHASHLPFAVLARRWWCVRDVRARSGLFPCSEQVRDHEQFLPCLGFALAVEYYFGVEVTPLCGIITTPRCDPVVRRNVSRSVISIVSG